MPGARAWKPTRGQTGGASVFECRRRLSLETPQTRRTQGKGTRGSCRRSRGSFLIESESAKRPEKPDVVRRRLKRHRNSLETGGCLQQLGVGRAKLGAGKQPGKETAEIGWKAPGR